MESVHVGIIVGLFAIGMLLLVAWWSDRQNCRGQV
jgi:FtsZ-interacting cell division protein ZipA